MIHEHALPGCISTVLAGYLKALGIHRLLAEGPDPGATSCWTDDGVFCVATQLDRDALLRFFLEDYAPTPLVTPWNGGSGFYESDQQAGIAAIEASNVERFTPYRRTIAACRALLRELGLGNKPAKNDKPRLLRAARARLADDVVGWLDAAYVMGDEPQYPALLGTGGNDGRLDFANNFMQRLAEMFLADEGGARRKRADPGPRLAAALFAQPAPQSFESVAVGQFAPGQAGGANMSTGTEGGARVNPWDFVLALEGALVFAGAAVRRLAAGSAGSASFPFHVRVSGIGYGSAGDADESSTRAELWLPLWNRAAPYAELRLLFSEGRLDVNGRQAVNGLHAAAAVASLGVDRGVERFQRLGILQRNGLAYLASHLGTFRVRHVEGVELLRENDLERFLGAVEQYVRGGRAQPAIGAALRATRTAMFDACRPGGELTGVLVALGALERAVSRSPAAREKVWPLARLSAEWYAAADDVSAEFRLAAAFASWRAVEQSGTLRQHLEPVDPQGRKWVEATPTWGRGDPLANVVAIARRRLLNAPAREGPKKESPLAGAPTITAAAFAALLDGRLDRARFADLAFGLALLPFIPSGEPSEREQRPARHIPNVFCVLRAVTSPRFLADDDKGQHPAPKVALSILARLAARDLRGAVELAVRRLRASGCHLIVPLGAMDNAPVPHALDFEALAAALVLPLPKTLERTLIERVAWRTDIAQDDAPQPSPEPEGEPA
jgi:CRISPR-associated protein Csx17